MFKIAWRNLKRNRKRNFATGAAISLGFIGLLLLGGYIYRVERYLRTYTIYASHVGHVIVYKKGGLEKFSLEPKKYSLSPAEISQIKSILTKYDHIEMQSSSLYGAGLVGNGCRSIPFLATGIEKSMDARLLSHPEMVEWAGNVSSLLKGKPISEFEEQLHPIGVSTGLAVLLGKPSVHDDISSSVQLKVIDCRSENAEQDIAADANVQLATGSWNGMFAASDGEIVNHYSTGLTETENAGVRLTLPHLQKLLDTESVASHSIWLKNSSDLSTFFKDFSKQLAESNLSVEAYMWNDNRVSPYYGGTMQFLKTMILFIAAVLLSIISFSIINSATMTILERSQEIGMMRSLGYRQSTIILLFMNESAILSLISTVVGGVLGILIMTSINAANIHFNPPGVAGGTQLKIIPNATIILATLIVVLIFSLLSTWVAVRRTSRSQIPLLLSGARR